jgi:hypothetical protein
MIDSKVPLKKMMMNTNNWTVPVIEVDDGELALEFSDELMDAMSLSIGDTIVYRKLGKDRWALIIERQNDE